MKFIKSLKKAFTLIELLVVITIIAILAGIALPVFSSVQVKGQQTKALSNAKQIALALRLYASDNNGIYPSFTTLNGVATSTTVADSNAAFYQLFPTYVQQEAVFWLSKSAWCSSSPPSEQQDAAGTDNGVITLAGGENEWAYVLNLNDSSNPSFPLIADGFNSASAHSYTTDASTLGGVWKGVNAIVVHADSSGSVSKVEQKGFTVSGPNGGASNGDIFSTGNAANWLGSANTVVNPRSH
jgi:prepilin-type N-terminal cleavage/methylation domain-containing protein